MSKYDSYNAVIKRDNSNFYVVTYSYFFTSKQRNFSNNYEIIWPTKFVQFH